MKRITKKRAKPEVKYEDARLIRLCCNLLAEIGAYRACTGADPDGNNVHVEPIWEKQCSRISRLLEQATATKATTLAGLVSKAAALKAIMDYESGMHLSEQDEAFIATLGDDVQRVVKAELDLQRLRLQERGEADAKAVQP